MLLNAIPWPGEQLPTETAIRNLLHAENLHPQRWSNAPGDTYDAHVHAYDKVLYVVEGEITFALPEEGQQIVLQAGDRFELPAGVLHEAVVGSQGVVCLEAHRT
jgi:quercetin dioxygenase-like cupin family protein